MFAIGRDIEGTIGQNPGCDHSLVVRDAIAIVAKLCELNSSIS